MEKQKIYVASSWNNIIQPEIVKCLRELGHDVYDFKEDNGFHWSDVDPLYKEWSPIDYVNTLSDSYVDKGYLKDIDALISCDMCILVLPCNRSSHLELGFSVGQGKITGIILDNDFKPELMYKMVNFIIPVTKLEDILTTLKEQFSIETNNII